MNRIQELQAKIDWAKENCLVMKPIDIVRLAEGIMEELRIAVGLPESGGE